MRHGILGGTFDPVHHGHLDVATAARRALALDEVELVPAGVPPHRGTPRAAIGHRLAMARLAVADVDGLTVSDLESEGTGPSYTSSTLDRLSKRGMDLGAVFLVTGADAFREIATWKDYPGLLERCHFVAVSRPGCPASSLPAALPDLAPRMRTAPGQIPARPGIFLVHADTAAVSSTEVRRRVAAGEPIDGLVPAAVARYIRNHGLYA